MVDDTLESGHVALDDVLDLVGQLRLDLLLQASEEKRAEHFVQAADDEQRLLLVELDLLAGGGEGRVEPLLERAARLEYVRQEEVEERPQLGQLVLQRRAGEQQAVRRYVERVQRHGQLAVVVLHAVALVDDHVAPAYLGQARLVAYDVLVGGREHVELAVLEQSGQVAALRRITLVHDVDDGRRPARKLVHPVGESGERHDDEERSVDLLLLHQIGDERNGLDGLAEAHLVGQDAVQVVVVERDEPLEAAYLIGLQLAADQYARLRTHRLAHSMRHAVVRVHPVVLVVLHLRHVRHFSI